MTDRAFLSVLRHKRLFLLSSVPNWLVTRRIRKGRWAAKNSTVSSCCLLWSLRLLLHQNFPAPPPSSSSANASFLSPPPSPSLRGSVVYRLASIRQCKGRSQSRGSAGCNRLQMLDWVVRLAPPSPGLVTGLVRSRCLELFLRPPASSCSVFIGHLLSDAARPWEVVPGVVGSGPLVGVGLA